MSRHRGSKPRSEADKVTNLIQFCREVRKSKPCEECGRMPAGGTILGGEGGTLSALSREPGMTFHTLNLEIEKRGWRCRSCKFKEEYPRKDNDTAASTSSRIIKELPPAPNLEAGNSPREIIDHYAAMEGGSKLFFAYLYNKGISEVDRDILLSCLDKEELDWFINGNRTG